jgi:electron transport complex protein RnfA
MGVSRRTNAALGMGLAVTLVMTLASLFTWLTYRFILLRWSLEYLKILVFIFIIAVIVQIIEIVIRYLYPKLYRFLGIYLPLITTNCAILGIAFINIDKSYSLTYSLLNAFFAGMGFLLALILMSGIRERLELGKVPKALQGMPIAFIVAALMSLAFLSFSTFLG